MPIQEQNLYALLKETFPDATITINDLAGDDDHYAVTIEDVSFTGQSRIACHQAVYKALQGKMGGELHAMQLTTKARKP